MPRGRSSEGVATAHARLVPLKLTHERPANGCLPLRRASSHCAFIALGQSTGSNGSAVGLLEEAGGTASCPLYLRVPSDGCAPPLSTSTPIRRSSSLCSGPCAPRLRNSPIGIYEGLPPEAAFGSCLTHTSCFTGARTRYQRSPFELAYSSVAFGAMPLNSCFVLRMGTGCSFPLPSPRGSTSDHFGTEPATRRLRATVSPQARPSRRPVHPVHRRIEAADRLRGTASQGARVHARGEPVRAGCQGQGRNMCCAVTCVGERATSKSILWMQRTYRCRQRSEHVFALRV
jgi:hypothetical protein